jgi:hypothetical protein
MWRCPVTAVTIVTMRLRANGLSGTVLAAAVAALLASAAAVLAPSADAKRRRPAPRRAGCGTFCQQAGPPAAGGPGITLGPPVKYFGKALSDGNGEIAVRAKCILSAPCIGALGIYPDDYDYRFAHRIGAVDIDIPAGRTATIEVPVSAHGIHLLAGGRKVQAEEWAHQQYPCGKAQALTCNVLGASGQNVTVRKR